MKKILVIDGDHQFVNSIKTAVSPLKYKILSTPTCLSGIHEAFQHDPDLILYNTNLDPLDGSEVFKVLQLIPSFSHIPIVYYKDKDDEQIKNFINNNGNSRPAKAQYTNRFQLLTEDRGDLPENNIQADFYDFHTLFDLSPNGLFIFDKKGILSVNKMLMQLFKADSKDASSFKMDDIFDKPSLRAIKKWMKDYLKNEKAPFNQQVIFKDREGDCLAMNLMIAEIKQIEDSIQFLGTFQAVERTNPIFNYHLAYEVCNLLKRENIEVSEALEKKITQTIKLRAINQDRQNKSFFTRRENEVLQLSMEGLSIKIIADKLSLSTRTVEKYRTKLMLKSGAKNIVEVIVFSIKNNLLKI